MYLQLPLLKLIAHYVNGQERNFTPLNFPFSLLFICSRSISGCCVTQQGDCIVLRDRKLNIAPAIKKQVSLRESNHGKVLTESINGVFLIFWFCSNHRQSVQRTVPCTTQPRPPRRPSTTSQSSSLRQSIRQVCQQSIRQRCRISRSTSTTVCQWLVVLLLWLKRRPNFTNTFLNIFTECSNPLAPELSRYVNLALEKKKTIAMPDLYVSEVRGRPCRARERGSERARLYSKTSRETPPPPR